MSDPPATVQTGDLTGVWARVHPRRQAAHATAAALLLTAWQDDLADVAVTKLITRYRQLSAGQDRGHRYQTALALILGVLVARLWLRTRAALGVSFERAYQEGEKAAGEHTGSPDNPSPATVPGGVPATVMAALLGATARRVARQLADSTGGAREQAGMLRQLLATGADLLITADMLVSAAYGRGLLAGYRGADVATVNWVTLGDGAVCQVICQANEDASPYPIADAPPLPGHGLCRCTLTPA